MVYLIFLSIPEAFLSLGTIIWAAFSDDVSPSAEDHPRHPVPIGHLPETEENDNGQTA